jgi:ribonucleotide reductase beta subunit family protein with ferritin-like domain
LVFLTPKQKDSMTEKTYLSQIETPTGSYVARYPWATEMSIEQQSIFWPAEELGVEEDEQDFRVGLNDAERHGLLTAQSVLTQYELMIGGEELWGGKISRLFPRPEIQRMAACFANVELGSHAPFYDIGNKVMGNSTDEFYTRWKSDPILAERIAFINACAASEDALEVTAALAFLEGAVLFTAFGFFKGFNSRGYNLIPHFVSGIDGSAKDENFHSIASARLFRECKAERIKAGNHSPEQQAALAAKIIDIAHKVADHERRINDMLFAIPGNRVVTQTELNRFLEDRIDVVLNRLEMPAMFGFDKGVISMWFYQQLSTVKVPDFFAATQLQYTRNWAKHKLAFNKELADAL